MFNHFIANRVSYPYLKEIYNCSFIFELFRPTCNYVVTLIYDYGLCIGTEVCHHEADTIIDLSKKLTEDLSGMKRQLKVAGAATEKYNQEENQRFTEQHDMIDRLKNEINRRTNEQVLASS